MNLRELKLNKSFEKTVPMGTLKRIYDHACWVRNNKSYETDRTPAEIKFANILIAETKLKFYQNVWIGNRNVDFFIPGIKFKEMNCCFKGLVIEIDGGVHNSEYKIKKDRSLYEKVFNLGMLVKCVLNEDLKAETVKLDLEALLKGSRTSSRERKRLWRNIYISTIFHTFPASVIEVFFSSQGTSYIQKLGGKHGK